MRKLRAWCWMCDCGGVADAQVALRHATIGYLNVCWCHCSFSSLRIIGEFPSGSPRCISRSDNCIASRVNCAVA